MTSKMNYMKWKSYVHVKYLVNGHVWRQNKVSVSIKKMRSLDRKTERFGMKNGS